MAVAIFLTGDLLRECAFNSRTSAFDQERRLGRPARLFAIVHLSKQKAPTEPRLKYHLPRETRRLQQRLRANQTQRRTQVSFKGPSLEIEPHSLRSYFCGLKLLICAKFVSQINCLYGIKTLILKQFSV
jgi:hypothetical protein